MQHKSIDQLLWSSQVLRLQKLSVPGVEGPLMALGSHHHITKHRSGCSKSKCTPCWHADMLTPTARMTFGYTSWRLLLWAEKEKVPAAPKGKGPLYPQVFLAPALCWLLLLLAGHGMTREGKHQEGKGSCDTYPLPPSLSFSNVSWKTNCSQPCELYLKHPHEP